MKIIITNYELKKATTRLSSMVAKKSTVQALEGFKISTDGDSVTLQASNLECFATIRIDDVRLVGVNPEYLYTAINLFYKEGIPYTVKICNYFMPIVITGGNWINVVMPMRIEEAAGLRQRIVSDYAN